MEQQNQQPIQEKTETKPSVKTNWKLLAIVTIVAVILVVGGILLLKAMQSVPVAQVPAPTPTPSPQPINNQQSVIDTSDWQTYRNEEFGFEVKYPEEFILVDVPDFKKPTSKKLIFFCFDYELNAEECGLVIGQFTVYPFSNPVSVDNWVINRIEQGNYVLQTIEQEGISKKVLRLRPEGSEDTVTLLLPTQETSSRITLDDRTRRRESYFIQTDTRTILDFNYTEHLETSITQPIIINRELVEAIFSTFRFID